MLINGTTLILIKNVAYLDIWLPDVVVQVVAVAVVIRLTTIIFTSIIEKIT